MMKANVGGLDRVLRIVLGLAAAYVGYSLDGSLSYVGYAVAALLLLTGAVGWCGLYAVLGLRTNATKQSA